MNYLAHLFLSCDNEDHLLGNFIADSIKRPEGLIFSKEIMEGIHLHKLIDQYTDIHPVVKQSTRRLHHRHRKYASVVVDIWYDHLLARQWNKYSNRSLREFADEMYAILRKRTKDMPNKLKLNLPLMADDDWLMKYSTMDGMMVIFDKLKKRVSKPDLLLGAKEAFLAVEKELEEDFGIFFPMLQDYVCKQHWH